MRYITEIASLENLHFQEASGSWIENGKYQKINRNPYFFFQEKIDKRAFENLLLPEGIKLGSWTYIGGEFISIDNVLQPEALILAQQIVDATNQAIQVNNNLLLEELAAQPVPTWYKQADIDLLAERLIKEFNIEIVDVNGVKIAIYENQAWNIASEESGHFTVEQGHYDYFYLPKLGKNLAQRLNVLSLRQSVHLSRETVKTFLYKQKTPQILSNKECETWFESWLGMSSWKPGYWKHHDINNDVYRVSVIANHAKDMLIITLNDGIHIFSNKQHLLVQKLPKLFYKFAKKSLVNGKDYSLSGTGWSLTW